MTPPIERPGPNSTLGEAHAYLAATALGVQDSRPHWLPRTMSAQSAPHAHPSGPAQTTPWGRRGKYLAAVGGLHGNITCPLCGQHKPRRRNGKRKSKVSR